MLLSRRVILDIENPEFLNAKFKRNGIIEFIFSNNFIYFNSLERAVIQDVKNNNNE